MKTKVKLNDIIEAFETTHPELNYSINTETGEVVEVPQNILLSAEELGKPDKMEGYPVWEKEMILKAKEIISSGKYLDIEGLETHDCYEIMEDFCLSYNEEKISIALLEAIKGKEPFTRFKEEIARLGLEKKWQKYKKDAIKKIAREWCKEKDIDYSE
jgi:hypothetical protein